ncbi:uncharacterized protein JN550_002319 [Neoarthrinium moseri]|uniref:uncharacterized protein n=1 Tax=Neoarthrinium moseri TaxID=1658444 RepID=UPI001FDC4CDE|nr:uncharacterized protein JN550_002319 [Neoarthrinium moseri]KAI1874890.1 hypothetical protein JN550_002319 [Neoarthrinium moseri]
MPTEGSALVAHNFEQESQENELSSGCYGLGSVSSSFSEESSVCGPVPSSSVTTISEPVAKDCLTIWPSKETQSQWPARRTRVVNSPYEYIATMPSKGVREKLIDALNIWFDCPEETVSTIKSVISMLHNSSLILDDFQDNSPLRRSKPSTHTVFGPAQSINSAAYIIIRAMSKIQSFSEPSCVIKATNMILTLFEGQAVDLSWTFNETCPSMQDYILMVDDKTGTLFKLAGYLLATHARVDWSEGTITAIDALLSLFGQYFQIRDDYQNLVSTEYTSQKGFCEDLDEGKYSITLIHALQNDSGGLLLRNMISTRRVQGKLTIQQKALMLDRIRSCGSLEWTVSLLSDIHQRAIADIGLLEKDIGRVNYELRSLVEMLQR